MSSKHQKFAAVSLLALLSACTEICEVPSPAAEPAPAIAPVAAPAPTLAPAPVLAPAPAADKPLVVIRFGQSNKIAYKQQLKDAIAKAEATKPGLTYDVVSYVPTIGDVKKDQREANTAIRNQQGITGEMLKMGIPAQRITVRSVYVPVDQMSEQEVRVYVK